MTTETRTPTEASGAYAGWLERQPLAVNTRRAYRVQVAQYCAYLAIRGSVTEAVMSRNLAM